MTYDLGVIGGGVAIQMARRALGAYGRIAITYLEDTRNSYPEFDFVGSVDALLDRRVVDAVYIATPVATHVQLVRRALEAGLPVLLEKPISVDLADARSLGSLDTSRIAVAFRKRYSAVAEAVKATRQAYPDDPCELHFTWLAPHPGEGHWKTGGRATGGGVCLDIGSHVLDLVEYCLGEVQELRAYEVRVDQVTGSDEYIRLNLAICGGSEAVVDIGWATGDPLQIITFAHRETSIAWIKDALSPNSLLYVVMGSQASRTVCRRQHEYDRMLHDFRSFTSGRGEIIADWAAGMRNMELISRILDRRESSSPAPAD
jgi:predicted dehydrogenase